MAEVKLKKKICLKRKEKPAEFVFTKYLKIKLLWKTKTDLDLCIFFTTKDGQAGGVFSSMFRQKKSDMGSLEEFPYMEHTGDKAEPSEGGESVEIQSSEGDYFEVAIDADQPGHVYHVCSIKNRDGKNGVVNEGVVMDLGTAFERIPGFSLICE